MVQTLVRHCLLRELAVRLVGVGHKGHSPRRQHTDAIHLSPLGKMPRNHLFDIIRDVYPAHIQRPVLPHEAPHPTHVIPVVTVLVPPEAVHVRVEQIVQPRQAVQVLALVAARAEALGEEQAEVRAGHLVRARVARVGRDDAAAGGVRFRQVLVLAVAAGPFVVPDVEDRARLRGGLGFHGRRVDLRPGGAAFAPDDLFGFFGVRGVGEGGGVVGGSDIGAGGVGGCEVGAGG